MKNFLSFLGGKWMPTLIVVGALVITFGGGLALSYFFPKPPPAVAHLTPEIYCEASAVLASMAVANDPGLPTALADIMPEGAPAAHQTWILTVLYYAEGTTAPSQVYTDVIDLCFKLLTAQRAYESIIQAGAL